MNEFSERFSTLRKKLKISQLEMSEKLKVTQKTLSSWEQGHNEPCNSLPALVNHYDVNLNWLLTGQGSMFMDETTVPEALSSKPFKINLSETAQNHLEKKAEILGFTVEEYIKSLIIKAIE